LKNKNLVEIASKQEVLEELDKILGNELFANSKRHSRLLKQIVEGTLNGDLDRLKEYSLAIDVFDRGEGFDPKTDPVVRVEARQLRMRLSQYYEGEGANDAIQIRVPKGAYRGEFEKRTQQEAGRGVPRLSKWWLMGVGIAVLGAVGVYLGVRAGRPETVRMIAVVPFVDQSEVKSKAYLGEELTDQINDALSHVRQLRVIGRKSVVEAQKMDGSPGGIGRRLGVDTILEGTIRQNGSQIRVIAQVLRSDDGSILWSRVFERKISELSSIRTEIATDVALSLGLDASLDRRRAKDSRDPMAQDHYLRARAAEERLSKESTQEAIVEYELALRQDPGYAAAYLGLANSKDKLTKLMGNQVLAEPGEVMGLLKKAIELDPQNGDARSTLALLKMQYEWDWAGAEREFLSALKDQSSAVAEVHLGCLYAIQGRTALAMVHLENGKRLDPLARGVQMNVGSCYFLSGKWTEAELQYQKLGEIWPLFAWSKFGRAIVLSMSRPLEALPYYREVEGQIEGSRVLEAATLALAKRPEEAEALLAKCRRDLDPSKFPRIWFAEAEAALGHSREAIRILEGAVAAHEAEAMFLAVSPWFQGIRQEPGFQALLKKMNLPSGKN
jgi:TolB-like protein